ncbi:hypothetical protein CEXT_354971 [Caerostris extrusa]|uniref:Uncharacterized protein n=1 Tax=Caerostris extrusa TaxID=172846 RepID=A0AAV4UQJ2_CAEEX|nr:hypothetical protein CEXT_354971 [Caerostris extrusa]
MHICVMSYTNPPFSVKRALIKNKIPALGNNNSSELNDLEMIQFEDRANHRQDYEASMISSRREAEICCHCISGRR